MKEMPLYILVGAIVLYLILCLFYFFFQERLIFVPWTKLSGNSQLLIGSEYNEHYIEGEEGGELHAIHIRTPQARGCILYFHGNTGSMSRWAAIAEELTSFGFEVFLPDYRGYGKSRGKRTEALLLSDAQRCYDTLRELYPAQQICIYGRSLGSGMASWLAGKAQAGAVVLETPYSNMVDVARYHSRIIPIKWLLRYTFYNDVHLRHCKAPVLIAHGTKDKIVPYKLGLRLYHAVKDSCSVKMLTIPGGHHGDLNGFPVFRKTLERFLDKHFPSVGKI